MTAERYRSLWMTRRTHARSTLSLFLTSGLPIGGAWATSKAGAGVSGVRWVVASEI
ncbi:MAG TPA: hypothetical protein VEX68_05900 [Bryobacteraceae bacterium]|nr:hypothetical protein [Bryobacteraceae bacterium]